MKKNLAVKVALAVSLALFVTGYSVALAATKVRSEAGGFIVMCVGLGMLVICMHALDDLQ